MEEDGIMDRTVLVVLSKPVEGREAEYNSWYNDRHLHDVLAVPGFVSVKRLKRRGTPVSAHEWTYCSLYEIDHLRPEKVVADMMSRIGTDTMPVSDALDGDFMCALYEPIVHLEK
jgi:hypothetical protein